LTRKSNIGIGRAVLTIGVIADVCRRLSVTSFSRKVFVSSTSPTIPGTTCGINAPKTLRKLCQHYVIAIASNRITLCAVIRNGYERLMLDSPLFDGSRSATTLADKSERN